LNSKKGSFNRIEEAAFSSIVFAEMTPRLQPIDIPYHFDCFSTLDRRQDAPMPG
jgi:hypothetical protein